ncbi:hypothetical protein JKG68_26385 [Microvirga aerilata]|uniref:Uncharacterized protein n=1 Tax=Microvirga aerilata TaxID=670292 RepID=A0A936ZK23_9HYPH|nr:hypothetical protein [Microvirga aerilata]MBL0407450.1 hypothetical protein [Microvirga aerilata]
MIEFVSKRLSRHWFSKELNKALGHVGLKLVRRDARIIDLRKVTNNLSEGFYRAGGSPFVVEVPLAGCRSLHTAAFPCTRESNNPFVSTLLSYQNEACSGYARSPLQEFHIGWQPSNAVEALGLDPESASPDLASSPPFGWVLPWMSETPQEFAAFWINIVAADYKAHGFRLDASHGWKVWGPVSDEAGNAEFSRLIRVYDSIRHRGYMRSSKRDGDITGTVLTKDSESRVLIGAGQHRVAVLAALGCDTAPVRIYSPHIRRSEVEYWPNVRSKLFSVEQALEIFDRIYDGRQPPISSTEINISSSRKVETAFVSP